MNRAKHIMAGLLMLATVGTLGAASDRGGERPAAYMSMGFGGRQVAMGGAGTALSGGLAAGTWNPAALTGVRTFQCYTQYAFLSEDRTLAYLGLGNRLESSPLSYAIAWIYFSAGGDLEFRQAPSLEPVYTFSDSQMAFLITTAYRLDERWSLGLNLKIMTHWLDQAFGWGFGEDLGFQFRVSRDTKFGFVVQDPMSALKFQNSDSGKTPPTVKMGMAHLFWDPQITFSADLAFSNDRGMVPYGGVEWRPMSGFALRAGWGDDSFRGGFGISTRGTKLAEEFNYVMSQDALDQGGFLHRLSLGLRFL